MTDRERLDKLLRAVEAALLELDSADATFGRMGAWRDAGHDARRILAEAIEEITQ